MTLPSTLSRARLLCASATLSALVLTLLVLPDIGCRTSTARRDDLAVPLEDSPELARLLSAALDDVPAIAGESRLAFDYRVRAALMASDDERLRAIAVRLPTQGDTITPELAWVVPLVIAKWAARSFEKSALEQLQRLVALETVNPPGTATPGRGPAFTALEEELSRSAAAVGLSFTHTDHIAFELSTDPMNPDDDAVTFIAHGDVVPADANAWESPPFALTLRGEHLVGRGTIDDKGPIAALIAALTALKQGDVARARTARLVVGTSEETHWAGIEAFQKVRPIRPPAIVADADFPIGVGEKGVLTLRIKTQARRPTNEAPAVALLVEIDGGIASNQVPATAAATLDPPPGETVASVMAAIEPLRASHPHVTVEMADAHLVVSAAGVAAHGAEPQRGENAIGYLITFLHALGGLGPTPCAGLVAMLAEEVGTQTDAARVGLDAAHPKFTAATMSLGTLKSMADEEGQCEAALNLRWPPPKSAAEVKGSVGGHLSTAARERGLTIGVEGGGLDPFLIDADAPWVQTLQESFAAVHGGEADVLTVAGTTYAKAVPGAVTFGPAPPGSHDGVPRLHAPNEYLTRAEFRALIEVYTLALARLTAPAPTVD